MTALGTSLPILVIFTGLIMGGAAFLTGQALAGAWRSPSYVVGPSLLLAAVDRFLEWGLFGEPPWSIAGLVLDFGILLAIALFAHRLTHVKKMVRQYPWLYARSGLLGYRKLPG